MHSGHDASRHRPLEQRTFTPADAFEDAAFALLLISAAAIADAMLALAVVI
jgi:hypothetical protein